MRVKISTIKALVLYNYRYLFAYFMVFVFALYFLAWKLGTIAPGLSQPEIEVAAHSSNISNMITQPIYPLHSALQWVSLHLLGADAISIRLPSILIAGATTLILYSLLKKWFGKITSLLCVAMLLSADWFLFIARLGTGTIEFSFWLTILIFSLMKLISKQSNWVIVYALASGMLLFCPYGIYALITTTVCMFVFKMFRTRISEASRLAKGVSVILILAAIGLSAWFVFKDTQYLKIQLGIVEIPSLYDYFKNLVINSSGVAIIWPDNNPLLGPSGIFLIRFFEFIFMAFGVVMLYATRVNRLNVVVIANAVVLALVSGLNSGSRGGSLLIVPAAIFMTAGLRHFIHRWERTFPKNPYAKVTLYLPLLIVILTTATLHFQSYFVLWPSQTATHQVFTKDLALLSDELDKPGGCIVYDSPPDFQTLVLLKNTTCQTRFINTAKLMNTVAGERLITTKQPSQLTLDSPEVSHKVLTSSVSQNNVRWYIYQL